MNGEMRFSFAMQDPAIAIAPVFLVLQKTRRAKLDITCTFGNSQLHWRGPDALGIPEQSVLLALLSIAGQQDYALNASSAVGPQKLLLSQLSCLGPQSDYAVLIAPWRRIEIAAGYNSHSGKNLANIKTAVQRLVETTIWERCDDTVYESRLLSFIEGNNREAVIALNRRATLAICGGQFVKISLEERNTLSDECTKALHAYLSGSIRVGSSRRLGISALQPHIWSGEAVGSTRRSRDEKLRAALLQIDRLPGWRCALLPGAQVEIRRIKNGAIESATVGYSLRDAKARRAQTHVA